MTSRGFLLGAFLLAIGSILPVQLARDLAAGERPLIAELWRRVPDRAGLRRFEAELERRSPVGGLLLPWMQLANFALLGDGGENCVPGREGWLFYRPGLRYLLGRWAAERDAALRAIRSFRDQLRDRGVRLLVMPVPGKASVHPERLSTRVPAGSTVQSAETSTLIAELRRDGIEVLDLHETFARIRGAGGDALYLARDTHWSPRGVQLAAAAAATRLLSLGWVDRGATAYEREPVRVDRTGDLVRMIGSPPLSRRLDAEVVIAARVVRQGIPYADDPESPVLLLGDSFARVYQTDAPGAAGLAAHLGHQLGFPVSSLVNDGGASTLVRQQLARRPGLLAGKQVVIWQFVERDIAFGVEGWQEVQLR